MDEPRRTIKLWQQTFAREANSPRFKLSWRILFAGYGAALLYTIVLTISGSGRATVWLQISQPLTHFMGLVVPSIDRISAELVQRGYADRAGYAANVLAFQWLASAVCWLLATALLFLERDRVSRAFSAAREVTLGSIPRRTFMNFYLPLPFAVGFVVWWPLDGNSFERGRGHYDLALGSGGLYFPFLAFTAFWWLCLYVVA